MLYNTIEIIIDYKAYGIEHTEKKATLTTYIHEMYPNEQRPFNRPFVIICPGGGYEHHSVREGEPVALQLLQLGFNVAVLKYSLSPNRYPCALYEAAYTMNFVRQHAKEWDTDPSRIIIGGFSAGGHVAASLGTMYNDTELREFIIKELKTTPQNIRPDGMLLGYSVLTSNKYRHDPSFTRLLGDRKEELLAALSLENRVNKDTPPAFLWHTFEDGSVPVENTLQFANALRSNNVKFELHIFPNGGHGLALGSVETDAKNKSYLDSQVAVWPVLFKKWLEKL